MIWLRLVNNCKQYCSSNFLGLAHFVLPIMIYLFEVEGIPTLTGGEKEIGVCHNYGQNLYKCEMSGNFDGTCTETLTHSRCDCNGTSETQIYTAKFWV